MFQRNYGGIEQEMRMHNGWFMDITHEMGGMSECQRTEIYPNYLIFSSQDLNRTRRLKVKEDPQKGSLKMGGKVIFNYIFSGHICKVQKVIDGIANPEWVEIQVVNLMCD